MIGRPAAAGPAPDVSARAARGSGRRVLAVPDKFRGTATAAEIAAAIGQAAQAHGFSSVSLPLADGGEGFLSCFGGANRATRVDGPLGAPVLAGWRLDGYRAVIESASASGLALVAGANDPLLASTRGTGQLLAAAIRAGARTVVVGVGGTASTDGGWDAVTELRDLGPLDGSRGVTVLVATDVTVPFVEAARVFGPQKGADAAQVAELTDRLRRLADRYRTEFGVELADLPGTGAAGGLAGGLAALGAVLRPGFDLVAEQIGLAERLAEADLVITGEGRLDETTFAGKAVGGVLGRCAETATPAVLIVGSIAPGVRSPVPAVSLVERFGPDAARTHTLACITEAAGTLLAAHLSPGPT